jgi:hypothetical protein
MNDENISVVNRLEYQFFVGARYYRALTGCTGNYELLYPILNFEF